MRWIAPDPAEGLPPRKRSWKSAEVYAITKLREYFGGQRLTAITPAAVEAYRIWRRSSPSRFGRPVLAGTVNREIAVLRTMWNVARKGILLLKGGMPRENPVSEVVFEPPHDVRDRIFSAGEVARLLDIAPEWIRPIILLAHQAGMRRGEIVSLRWEQVDVKRGVIRLRSGDTKTAEGRVIPLPPPLKSLLATLPRGLGQTAVFLNPATGRPYTPGRVSMAFQRTCRRAGLTNVRFHDLRHTFVTNARRAKIDYLRIMAITGHKTLRVFQRYNLIGEGDLQDAMATLQTYLAHHELDTSMDTSASEVLTSRLKDAVNPRG
jgi:integrase